MEQVAAGALPTMTADQIPRAHSLLDHQSWSRLLAGALLLLISFTTNDGDDNLLQLMQT